MTRRATLFSISNGRRAVVGSVMGAALLLPWRVTAESGLHSGARTASVGATAHLDFKIIIPPVLALSIEGAGVPAGGAPWLSIFTNTRHLLLTSSAPIGTDDRPDSGRLGSSDAAGPRARGSAANLPVDGTARTVLFSAPRHAVISAQTGCQIGGPRTIATPGRSRSAPLLDLRPVVCTVAMP